MRIALGLSHRFIREHLLPDCSARKIVAFSLRRKYHPGLHHPTYMYPYIPLLSISSHAVRFFCIGGWHPGTWRDLGCYLDHLEMILTYPTPPGLTELPFRFKLYINVSARLFCCRMLVQAALQMRVGGEVCFAVSIVSP